MYLLLALLLQAAPVSQSLTEARAVVARGLDEFDRDVQKLAAFMETRFDADANVPKTGIAVESAESTGEDGLHALTVMRVLVGGPADIAGVRPGDRIVAVGRRRITHESEKVFQIIADGAPGLIELTLSRNGTTRTVTIDRAPLACLQRSSDRIDLTKWRAKIAELRRLSGMVRSELDDESITPAQMRYSAAKDHVVALYGLIRVLAGEYSGEMMAAADAECSLR